MIELEPSASGLYLKLTVVDDDGCSKAVLLNSEEVVELRRKLDAFHEYPFTSPKAQA